MLQPVGLLGAHVRGVMEDQALQHGGGRRRRRRHPQRWKSQWSINSRLVHGLVQ